MLKFPSPRSQHILFILVIIIVIYFICLTLSPLNSNNLYQAKSALEAYPQGLQIGGGITASNASEWLSYGASHVIVTSFVFHNGKIDFDRLNQLVNQIGKDKLVLDLSCRRKSGDTTGPYYVVTDRKSVV